MRILLKGLRFLIKEETKLFVKLQRDEDNDLKLPEQKRTEELKAQEKKVKLLQKKISDAEKSEKSLQNKIVWTQKRMQENGENEIWHRMLRGKSVARTLRFCNYFGNEAHTWNKYEEYAKNRNIVLIGEKRDCRDYFDRYPWEKEEVTILDPQKDSWKSMMELLEEYGQENTVVFLMNQDWEEYAACMEIIWGALDNIFVYKLMEHQINEKAQMENTWETFKQILPGRKLVLVTPNPRAKEFIEKLGSQFPVSEVLSAKKKEMGISYFGYTVQSVYEAEKLFPKETVFLLCSVNWNDYINRLKGKGFSNIFSLRLLCRANQENEYSNYYKNVLAVMGVEAYDGKMYKEKIQKVMTLLADEDSKVTMKHVLELRKTRKDDWWFAGESIADGDPLYFEREFLHFNSKEAYLDVGPQDGGTIIDFINRVHNRFKKVYAWEIGEDSLKVLRQKFVDNRIEILPYGAWHENVQMGVVGSNGGRSVSNQGKQTVLCKRIDDVIHEPITMIKMDIEGAEMNALIGAKETIKKYKPKLAISVYHKYEDIWELPLFIHELVPEYKLYIRHHRTTQNDTVLYATL